MGLDTNAARYLLGEKERGIQFGKILTLGRQGVYMENTVYDRFMTTLGVSSYEREYADDFFRGLGADQVKSMDASSYENADFIQDINEDIDPSLNSAFDTVIDGGTLEHVFNYPTAIRNCMRMVRKGGQLILMTPWHNYPGHGFYQFSPELIYSILSPENGYQVERMLIVADGSWYSVKKPAEIRQRIEISTRDEVMLHVTARRISDGEIFSRWPQQSDYSEAWERGSYAKEPAPKQAPLRSRVIDQIAVLRKLRRKWRRLKSDRLHSPSRNHGLVKLCSSSEVPQAPAR